MTYRITARADSWVRAENGAPELRQVITEDLGDETELVVIVVRSPLDGPPRVAEARIEQAYITRTAGWKRRTIQRLQPHEIDLVD